jgi:ribosome-associated toxin RatA of RatAB toxin-antitoxin module
MTENVETPYQSVTFRMIEGDLKMLRGCWQLHVLDEPAHTLLITQVITAHAELGPFKKLFYKVFKASVEETMQALRQEVSRRQEISS